MIIDFRCGSGSAPIRISGIVRTVGRESLAASLRSLAAQRLPPAEVVVVRAREVELPAFPDMGSIPVRVVGEGTLDCPRAANAGLAAAQGTHIIFLDDDDTFDAEHLATLAEALRAEPAARVAYSATLGTDLEGRPVGDLDFAFDRALLFKRNYIQMGAALFERSLVDEGCRFDERLEAFEDWDFWIQLAMRTHFACTRKKTNRWCLFSGSSGTGARDSAKDERLARLRDLVQRKWAPERLRLAERVRYLEGRAATSRGEAQQRHRDAIRRLLSGPVEAGIG